MENKEEMDKIIFEIGDFIRIRYKGFFKRIKLTPQEIIDSYEFKNIERRLPFTFKLILDNFNEVKE